MALPAIIGIPALVSWFTGVFGAVAAWFIARFGERVALRIAMVAVTFAAAAVAVASIKLLIAGVVPTVPAPVVTALTTVLPTNTDELIAIYIGIEGITIALARFNHSRAPGIY